MISFEFPFNPDSLTLLLEEFAKIKLETGVAGGSGADPRLIGEDENDTVSPSH